jgi:hypothetical protein
MLPNGFPAMTLFTRGLISIPMEVFRGQLRGGYRSGEQERNSDGIYN